MSFSPMICEDCSLPPNWVTCQLPKRDGKFFSSVKCRDCGDEWEEPDENADDIEDQLPNEDDPEPFR